MMLPDEMAVGDIWWHPQQSGSLGSYVAGHVVLQGKARGWIMARCEARAWMRCRSADHAKAVTRDYWKAARYGITGSELRQLQSDAGGACLICQLPADLHVDHCHTTGLVRGLLCVSCNTALGRMMDRPDWLRRAADYIDLYRSKHETMRSTK